MATMYCVLIIGHQVTRSRLLALGSEATPGGCMEEHAELKQSFSIPSLRETHGSTSKDLSLLVACIMRSLLSVVSIGDCMQSSSWHIESR